MSPTDVPQVPSEHTTEIIGGNWPQTSETGTVASAIELYRHAAESVGTGDVSATMEALIEANATGHTPDTLVEHFTAEQRAAFDRALTALNRAQGASVMAQDILNTKVALNGTVVSFKAAVDALLAEAAAAPQTPKTQEEFKRRYDQLLDEAKAAADQLGQNHRDTQTALANGVARGSAPEIPSTMAPTSPENPTVPGMPIGALGSVLQNVAGQMLKPENLPFPKLDQLGQAVSPVAQSAQAAIGQLMSSLGGAGAGAGGGVPISDDALAVLTKASGAGDQNAALSAPGGAGTGAGAAQPGTAATALASDRPAAKPLSAPPASNATAATNPAVTSAPPAGTPATTLSAAGTAALPDTLNRPVTHIPADAAAAASAQPAAVPAATAGVAPAVMPVMPAAAGAAGAPPSAPRARTADVTRDFTPTRPEPDAELGRFGAELDGLEHATDNQQIAARLLAGLIRAHDRAGVSTEIAVGLGADAAVFATSDGLGFVPQGALVAANLTPLVELVPDGFIARWLGCDQPWRPLLEAAELNLAGPFTAVVSSDTGAAAFGVLTLDTDRLAAVSPAVGARPRWEFGTVEPGDTEPALTYLTSVWGRAPGGVSDTANQAAAARWTGDSGPGTYPRRWARHLITAAAAHLAAGDVDDARYELRAALRIPPPERS